MRKDKHRRAISAMDRIPDGELFEVWKEREGRWIWDQSLCPILISINGRVDCVREFSHKCHR